LSCVWLRPPHAPKIAVREAISISRWVWRWINTFAVAAKGASFCQVIRIRAAGQEVFAVTAGSQWCKGATPSLVSSPASRARGDQEASGVEARTGPKRSRAEPTACARKYCAAELAAWRDFWAERRGINANRFISSPIQIVNQLEPDIVRTVPTTSPL